MKIMKKPGDWCGEDVLKSVDNPIKAFLAMKHRWKAEVYLDDCDLVNVYLPRDLGHTPSRLSSSLPVHALRLSNQACSFIALFIQMESQNA
jgi:hypothetical protein